MSESNIDLRETHIIGVGTYEQIVNQSVCSALAIYGIYLVGRSWASSEFRFVRHKPVKGQLLVCLEGQGEVWIDNGWRTCAEGMAYITPPGVLHAYHTSPGHTWHTCWVSYEPEEQEHFFPARTPLLLPVEVRDLSTAIEGLYREAIGQRELAALHPWAQLISVYGQRMLQHTVGGEQRLQSLWQSVNADIAHPWRSRELAERAGISPEHLRRLCQSALGCSPMRYVTLLRMRQAAVLLSSDAYTVDAVAQRVGYENAFAFSTAFKRIMGSSPTSYRQASSISKRGSAT